MTRTYTLPPSSRRNIYANVDVPELGEGVFSADIQVLNFQPIAVEKAMYWNAGRRDLGGRHERHGDAAAAAVARRSRQHIRIRRLKWPWASGSGPFFLENQRGAAVTSAIMLRPVAAGAAILAPRRHNHASKEGISDESGSSWTGPDLYRHGDRLRE